MIHLAIYLLGLDIGCAIGWRFAYSKIKAADMNGAVSLLGAIIGVALGYFMVCLLIELLSR